MTSHKSAIRRFAMSRGLTIAELAGKINLPASTLYRGSFQNLPVSERVREAVSLTFGKDAVAELDALGDNSGDIGNGR